MNTQEKSLALAELMGWAKHLPSGGYAIFSDYSLDELSPYAPSKSGLAQFAAILLNHLAVFEYRDGSVNMLTQESILDEILKMEGKL